MPDNNSQKILMGKTTDFPEGKKIRKEINEQPLFILFSKGKWYAFETKCPHQSRPLDDARIKGNILECIYHSMNFNMDTGEVTDTAGYIGAENLVIYKVTVDDEGNVWVNP